MEYIDKLEQLCDFFNQIVNQYGQFEKEFHTCEINASLHLSDTHTIVDIGKNPYINITNLSKLQGVSRSAVSQMISKLVKRGFVKKEISPRTDNEVILSLTESGKRIFCIHEKQHEFLQTKLTAIFKKYPENTIDILMELGTEIQDLWKNNLQIE
ncbi:MarR family transcriptional regulator [Clostridioides difficile]|nr:MarR family transcriptional regulator [Clostridioides difficile]